MSQNDNIDTCTVCEKEIPPGPDFCGHACETKFVLVQDLARELYDRFVMGGWEPVDSYAWISKRLREAELSGDSPRPQESAIKRAARAAHSLMNGRLYGKVEHANIHQCHTCDEIAEIITAELREAEAPRKPSEDLVHELGFEVKREDGDVLIRDSDDLEWTSGKVWARSAPETIVTMLADLWRYARKFRQHPEPAPKAIHKYRGAIDAIYNSGEVGRELVIKHFGLCHPQIGEHSEPAKEKV